MKTSDASIKKNVALKCNACPVDSSRGFIDADNKYYVFFHAVFGKKKNAVREDSTCQLLEDDI
jgi:hypothetical protein